MGKPPTANKIRLKKIRSILYAMKRPSFLFTLIAAAASLLTASCEKPDAQNEAAKLNYPFKAGATVAMIADVVKNVAGDKAQVTGLIGEGVDPHLYKPTSYDVKLLQASDIVFYNGLMLEGKMGDCSWGRGRRQTSRRGDRAIAPGPQLRHDGQGGALRSACLDARGRLEQGRRSDHRSAGEIRSANADYYKKRGADYMAELKKLDDYGIKVSATIPKERRVLVTAHDAFNYFGRAYDLEVRGIQGISTESEAGLQDINELVNFIVEHQIPAVFVESCVSQKNIRALVEGAKAKGQEVKIGGELFSDAMGETGTYEGTYIGMLDHNITTIARALGGEAPEKGLNGKLSK